MPTKSFVELKAGQGHVLIRSRGSAGKIQRQINTDGKLPTSEHGTKADILLKTANVYAKTNVRDLTPSYNAINIQLMVLRTSKHKHMQYPVVVGFIEPNQGMLRDKV